MKLREFGAMVKVGDSGYRVATGQLDEYITRSLTDRLTNDLRGPRGGRYVPVGNITFNGRHQTTDDYARNMWSFTATRLARYVRPQR